MWNLPATVPLIALLLVTILTLGVVRYSVLTRQGKVLVALLLCVALWAFSSFMFHSIEFPSPLFWGHAVVAGGFSVTAVGLHFAVEFPRRWRGATWLLSVYYLATAVMFALLLSGQIVESAALLPNGLIEINFGPMAPLGWAWATVCLVNSVVLLSFTIWGRFTPEEKKRARYPLIGFIFLISGYFSNIVVSAYPVDVASSFVFVGFIAYATVKGNLLRPTENPQRYLLLAVSLWLGLLVYGALLVVFWQWLGADILVACIGAAVIIAVIALVLSKTYKLQAQRLLTRILFPETFHYWEGLEKLRGIDTTKVKWQDALSQLLDIQLQVTRAASATLAVFEKESGFFKPVITRGSGYGALPRCELAPDSPIVSFLAERTQVLTAQNIQTLPQFKVLLESEQKLLDECGLGLFCGICTSNGLIGIIALASDPVHRAFTDEEIDFCKAAANNIAPIIADTLRKRAEEALEESEQRYRSLFDYNPDAVFSLDLEGRFTSINESVCRISGYPADRFFGIRFEAVLVPADYEKARRSFIKAIAGQPQHYEATIVGEGGRQINLDVTNLPIIVDGKITGVFGIAKDITERKQAEELFRTIAVNSPVGVYIVQNREFLYVNPHFQECTGYHEGELKGMRSLELVVPEDREMVRENAVQMLKGKRIKPYEFRVTNKNGDLQYVSEAVAPIQYLGQPATIAVFRDITERKQMAEQLIQTDRLASIGELASGIAHEMNNPLTGVIGLSDLLLSRELPDDIKEDLQWINKEAHRTANVVKNLLTFARKHPKEKKPVNIEDIIKMVLELRAYEQKVQNIQVTTRFPAGLPEIMANSFQLMQVFINIVTNSEHFMVEAHNGGVLDISVKRVAGGIRVIFADDGPGIPQNHLGNIFNPFFTTKEVGKGTGLGLSICHGIITEHNGRIWAESKPGKGATFTVQLPVGQ